MTAPMPPEDWREDWRIGSDLPEDRILAAVERERWRHGDVEPPNAAQIAMVLHGLADHTALMQAVGWRPDLGSPWPTATSVGRWLHDLGDRLDDAAYAARDQSGEPC